MTTSFTATSISANRIGFHYFQDTAHYTNKDLNTWLPELVSLKAQWIVLLSDSSRAIPEQFIHGIKQANISPIVHFHFRLPDAPNPPDMRAIFTAYAHWGVKYVVLFNKPNEISSWAPASWSQQDLVERFIDRFIPLAHEALRCGLTPVFPPLEPGGDYWDTSFLRSALASIQRRGGEKLLHNLTFAVTSYTFGHEFTWGEGGPQKWTGAKPYSTPSGCEDQCGINNWQWVESIVKNAGIPQVNLFQFGCGLKTKTEGYAPVIHADVILEILEKVQDSAHNSIKGSLFWLLAADPGTTEYNQAWFKGEGRSLPIVKLLKSEDNPEQCDIDSKGKGKSETRESLNDENSHPIDHYLLLPSYEWGVADWHLEVTRPFIIKHHPTVGYSIAEAMFAKKVTVIGGDNDFSPDKISHLRNSGCEVEQISGDGTSIASILAQR